MRDGAGLSDHEYMREFRLPMWGAWGRWDTDKPNAQRLGCSIYQMGRADKQGEQTTADGDITNADEDPPRKMDIVDCEHLDFFIAQLAETHKQVIRRKFYKELPVSRIDTDAAVRALLDKMADNRKVVDRMRRL